MADADPSRDHAFWKFSIAVYAAPGVAAECLALQERYGLDVNVLLFCAWLGSRKIGLTADELASVEAVVKAWHDSVVRPLRSVRQYLKGMPEAERLRGRVKAEELDAEKSEQAMLFAYAQRHWVHDGDGEIPSTITSNLKLFLQANGHKEESAGDLPFRKGLEAVLALSGRAPTA
jgi:uncharacterized protein (TIGR02444 family)